MPRIRFGGVEDVPHGGMRKFIVRGRWIVIANVGEEFYAIDGRCSHMGGDLSKGDLEGHVIQCPVHGAEFDLRTGEVVGGPFTSLLGKAGGLRTFPVEVVDGEIMVKMEASDLE